VPVQDVARINASANARVLQGPELRTIFLGMDQKRDELLYSSVKGKNPFKDKRVRQAFFQAIDIEGIKRTVMRGASNPTALMVGPGVNGFFADMNTRLPHNVDAAKKLLADAGYPNGFEFQLNCPNNRYVNDEEVCQAVVNMWARVGVRVKLNAQNFAGFIAKIQNFDTSAYLLGWGVATYDALYSLQSLARTRAGGADGNFNFLRISNARLDSVVDRAKTENDTLIRDRLLREGLAIVRDEALYVPIHHQIRPWAMKKNIEVVHRADNRLDWRLIKVN